MAEHYAVDLDHVSRIYNATNSRFAHSTTSQSRFPQPLRCHHGPSGSGKTTMLNLIAGIDHATSGRVAVGNEEITTMKEAELAAWRARHIGLVFQFYNLIPVLTAFENVELPLLLTPLKKAERRDHVEIALKAVGLADRMAIIRASYPVARSSGSPSLAPSLPTRRSWWPTSLPAISTPPRLKISSTCSAT